MRPIFIELLCGVVGLVLILGSIFREALGIAQADWVLAAGLGCIAVGNLSRGLSKRRFRREFLERKPQLDSSNPQQAARGRIAGCGNTIHQDSVPDTKIYTLTDEERKN